MIDPTRREELDAIRREQSDLRTRLQALGVRLERFEQANREDEREDAALAAMLAKTPPPAPAPVMPPPLPPQPVSREPRLSMAPPPLPVIGQTAPPPASEPSVPPLPVEPQRTAPRESLEMQIGTTWLVRAGVVFLLTALAFAGSWLYYNIVPILGPVAKLALMYLGAGALAGAGAWLERSRFAEENEALKNYARVVLAGGLAAVYYVTYSAHWNPHLRVVHNPLLAGGLLLGWAAFMVWLADRRGSELMATFAILLAFYTSAINEIGQFTLVANLFLAGGAVYLLRRQLWQVFPFVSLLATFGSYGFWRFSHAYIEGAALGDGTAPHIALTTQAFWIESAFLLLYWLLFTWAVFTADNRTLPRWRRAGFVTVNNSAAFLLTTWLLLSAYPGNFWKLSLGFGVVLLALAEGSRQRFRVADADTENAYLLQGVLLVTLGFIGYFSDWQLSLVLAVQSAVLLWRAGLRTSRLLLALSCAVAVVSAAYALDSLHRLDTAKIWLVGLAEGALLVGNAWWSQQLLEKLRSAAPVENTKPTPFQQVLAPAPTGFAFLGSTIWFWTVELAVKTETARAPALVGAAVLLTASIYVLRLRALPWLAQAFLVSAHFHWLVSYGNLVITTAAPPLWNPLALLASTLALGHWWQWRRAIGTEPRGRTWGAAELDAVLLVGFLNFWLGQHAPWGAAGWMAEAALLSMVILGYGVVTRYRALAEAGQLLLAASVWTFVEQWDHPWSGAGAERWLALSPLLAMLAALVVGRRFAPPGTLDRGPLGQIARVYEIAATLLFLAWAERYVPRVDRSALLTLAGAVVFAVGCVYRTTRWQILSAAPTVFGLGVLLFENTAERQSWLGLATAAILAGQQQFGKRWLADDASAWFPAKAQGTLMTAAVLCAWAFLTARMEPMEGSAFTLAASWALFALVVFAAGLLLHERVYRWLGLFILTATLGHLILFDIGQLDTLGKAISFFVLGLVVLGVGFLYVRFQSKFRDLL